MQLQTGDRFLLAWEARYLSNWVPLPRCTFVLRADLETGFVVVGDPFAYQASEQGVMVSCSMDYFSIQAWS